MTSIRTLLAALGLAILAGCGTTEPASKPAPPVSTAKHSATTRRHGAAPILFMSWAYQDKPEMTQQL